MTSGRRPVARPVLSALPLLLILGLPGCSQPGQTNGQPSGPAVTPGKPDAAQAVDLKTVRFNELDQAIAAGKGKIVVVDIWATWCVACRKEFPHLVQMHNRHKNGDVVCISVTVDDEEDKAPALEFLQEQKADFANFLLKEEVDAWQKQWAIKGIPVVFVYGKDGKLARQFNNDDPDNQFTYQDVNKLVDELLAGKQD